MLKKKVLKRKKFNWWINLKRMVLGGLQGALVALLAQQPINVVLICVAIGFLGGQVFDFVKFKKAGK